MNYREKPSTFDALLEANPPQILWRSEGLIQVAVVVEDPHPDSGHNGTKAACKRKHPFTDDNTIVTSTGRQCRTCTNKRKSESEKQQRRQRQRETPLLVAARTDI